MARRTLLLMLFCLSWMWFTRGLVAQSLVAQSLRTPILVGCDCGDRVGSRYAAELREQIARSSRFSLVSAGVARSVAAAKGDGGYTLDIISVGLGEGKVAALSVALTSERGLFLGHVVQTCRETQVEECARRTIAAMDSEIARQ